MHAYIRPVTWSVTSDNQFPAAAALLMLVLVVLARAVVVVAGRVGKAAISVVVVAAVVVDDAALHVAVTGPGRGRGCGGALGVAAVTHCAHRAVLLSALCITQRER